MKKQPSQIAIMNQATPAQRDGYWDLIKAFLITFVIWGHCIQFLHVPGSELLTSYWESACFKGIYLFHMPLFIFISGYFAAASIRRHGLPTLSRYACRLMIPAVTYALFHIALCLIVKAPVRHPWEELANLWFLVVVFECTCLYFTIRRLRFPYKAACLFLIPSAVAACQQFFPILIPAASHLAYLWPFFLVGAWAQEGGLSSHDIPKKAGILFAAIIPCALCVSPTLFVYNTPLGFSLSSLYCALLRTLIATVLSLGFLGVGKCVERMASFPLVSGVAKATLALYVLHVFFFGVVRVILPRGIPHLHAALVPLIAAVVVLLLYGLYLVLRRIPVLSLLLFGEK